MNLNTNYCEICKLQLKTTLHNHILTKKHIYNASLNNNEISNKKIMCPVCKWEVYDYLYEAHCLKNTHLEKIKQHDRGLNPLNIHCDYCNITILEKYNNIHMNSTKHKNNVLKYETETF